MEDRTGAAVCRLCTELATPGDPKGLGAVCRAWADLERLTSGWSIGAREATHQVVYAVVRHLPPDEAGEFFALMTKICVADH